MTLNLSGITPIPLASVDIPSDALSMYNLLVQQVNSVLASGGTGIGPAFQTDGLTGNLTSGLITLQVLILVELRCIRNMLDLNQIDPNQMRANELFDITNSLGAF